MPEPSSPRPPGGVGQDAAWVSLTVPLAPTRLHELLEDPERLLRVNSQWRFACWELDASGRFRLQIQNHGNGQFWETSGQVRREATGLRLDYDEGLKTFTRFIVEPTSEGTRLWVVEDYGRIPEAERPRRVAEVDPSLPRWGQDLCRYLRSWARWSRLAPWRWYMERVWRPMSPLGRRVTRLLLWASLAELLLFAGLVAVLGMRLTP